MHIVLRQRQIHLDFHTGPWIPDVGADFDARQFADTMKRAHVNSVTVFAKCHHGHLYFPTRHPARHPSLKRGLDLTGRQIQALHRVGIRAPVYISVQCDEFAANTHPEWVALHVDGKRAAPTPLQAGYQTLDMSSPYQDYLAAQTEEILARFRPVDGVFFDMCWDQPSLGWHARERMLALGYDPANEDERARYAREVSRAYMRRFFRLVKRSAPDASVYFNSRPLSFLPDDLPCLSHVEIEALPTGGWGYLYFPKNVRYARTFGKPVLGMTARFHRSWGDFGGLKPEAALKYEVCQMLAHGAQCSIGDQLHPRGRLDRAAYELIGRVYGYVEQCEPWTDGARPVTEIGLFRAGRPGQYQDEAGGSNDGATRLLTHLKHQFDVVHAKSDLRRYRLLILPEATAVDRDLAKRLRAFVKSGGSLLLSAGGDLSQEQTCSLPEMGVRMEGESPFQTVYIRFGREISWNVPSADHVMYERGLRMRPAAGAKALAKVVEPYFDRSYRHFSSHNQTPPLPTPSRYAAAIQKGRVITIAFPIFKAFGTHGSLPYRALVANCIERIMHDPLIRVEAPSTTEVTLMRQGRRTVVHLLQFVAERRHAADIVEDVVPLFEVPLEVRTSHKPKTAYLAPARETLPSSYTDGVVSLTIPKVNGHQMVVLE